MAATSVTVVIPAPDDQSSEARDVVAQYLETTGFAFDVVVSTGSDYGSCLRKGISEARGSVIVVVDQSLPYAVGAIGDAVAMIDSGAADVVFASSTSEPVSPPLLRWLLVPILPDASLRLMAFSSPAAKLLAGESRLRDDSCDLELAFLGNKYGFRVEYLVIQGKTRRRTWGTATGLIAALKIRLANRRNAYRAARRCPVCFSAEVWTRAQIPRNVVRSCRRCKCRYLNHFADSEGSATVRRLPRAHAAPAPPSYESHSPSARERTSLRRLQWVRRQLPPRARLLEIGVRDGSFGALSSTDYEYVGIDPAPVAARHARARGLEVYCASLSSFVNIGSAFDAITLFHVLENMSDPHDALSRIKDLLKPGGILFLSTFDTEGLLYLMSERGRMAQNFRTHSILYSRSALIELLERSGFEIGTIGPDFEFRDQKLLRHWLSSHYPVAVRMLLPLLRMLPDPLIVSTGSIRIVAKRRAGPPLNVRAIRSVEPTHAR